ncbi:Met18p NDAI_0F02360 [Naumovozyma dairenensis CBS 421]|uniref:MMS19 nucleotide excision repair protein n=1 Tax=Naumovozyma dairenensis (strain ATCC 10597 / BCRC 20456 / CBS 421 / NBRC 0211 / NRRL Y-12639) TaxID=1071378 RepID=G0WCP3_NAUDC|nr:hypothetical protein NDAI_0F02360 [Naumovozyma dairenensis CBS 421]CCD25554.1 hypothetical protein NDAI_0F02360 [Naumovozyma dairenensis CBS 421]
MAHDDIKQSVDAAIIMFLANVNVNEQKADQISLQLASYIQNKSIKLLDIILALKDEMTSDEDSKRQNSLHCLSSILSNIPHDLLLRNEISVIFNFYKSKFDDDILMKFTLDAFNSLIAMKYISINEITTLLTTLKESYDPSKFLAATRFIPFEILQTIYIKDFITKHPNLNDLFIETFIHIATGEKDPKNLLISFKLNKLITTNLKNVTNFKNKLFDILFAYFPITFKPPKNDPYKISNSDLKLALRSALSSSSIFASDVFDNLIDKMSASSPIVKNDTLLTMKSCIENYGGQYIIDSWLPIWTSLKFELIHNSEGSTESTMLNPITNESTTISTTTNSIQTNYQIALNIMKIIANELEKYNHEQFLKFFNHIFEELKPNFTYEKDLKQSCSILASIGSANLITFNTVITNTLPLFLQNTSEIPKLKLLLMNLSFFLDSYVNVFGSTTIITTTAQDEPKIITVPDNKLFEYKDEILMILGMALTGNSKLEVTVRTLSIIQFTKMIKMVGYLTEDEISLIVQYITETILTDSNKNIYYACLEGLKVISEFYENVVFEVSLKKMLDLLPNDASEFIHWNNDEIVPIERILKIILDFTTSRHILVQESIIYLCGKLSIVAKIGSSNDYCFLLLSTLYSLFENNVSLINENDAINIKNAVENDLFNIMINDRPIAEDDHNLSLLSNVLFFISLKIPLKTHQDQLNRYNKIFIDDYKILEKPSRLALPYSKILSGLDKNVQISNVDEIFQAIVALLTDETKMKTTFENIGYLELLMILSNKWLSEDKVIEFFKFDNLSITNLEILTWLGKGLVMKNSKYSKKTLENFIALLSNEDVGVFVSKLFEIFVIDINSLQKFKNITYNNNVKLLYKQKFFSDIFQTLVNSYKSTQEMTIKCNYLTALSLILKHTPSNLVEPFIEDLLPLLLQALEMPNAEVRISSLGTLKDSTEKFHQLITDHVDILVPMLLKLVLPDKFNTINVRLLSLQLLELLTTVVPLNYCENFKQTVIDGLLLPLSDKKRIVRKQCIDTRQAYFELGQIPFE